MSKVLVSVAIPNRNNNTEDLDYIRHATSQLQVPLVSFTKDKLESALKEWLELCKPDVVLVYTFPFKIPTSVLTIPSLGFINFHFGLLPKYRGADAIFWQICHREKEGGISIHKMTERYDAGEFYAVHKVPILPMDTYGSHLLNLSLAAVNALGNLLQQLQSGAAKTVAQDESLAGYYKRPALKDVSIDWNKSAADVIALVNATNPWNKGAVAYLNDYPVKIIAASAAMVSDKSLLSSPAGTIVKADKINGCQVRVGVEELLNLDLLYCNDSFLTSTGFIAFGIMPGMRFK